MPVIRHVQVVRFRGIREASWSPHPGVNAIIGSGDTGKSTLLDAIETALAPRRNITFSDADFWNLDVSQPIDIRVTIGDLPDTLLDLERYGAFHRGWDSILGLHDEPASGAEVVVTVRLAVDQDLDPRWCLYSDRADADGKSREIPSGERQRLAPIRLGAFASHHLAWGARSILNKIAEVPNGAGGALAEAARQARATFGEAALDQVRDALSIVRDVATRTGVPAGRNATALLDAHGISLNGGTIALHDEAGVPLRNLGTGSSRLLIAGLQAGAGGASPFVLVDEVEHGLEPYRTIRLLHTLGSKDAAPTRQVFLTTHSPVVVRELSANQLWRAAGDGTGQVAMRRLGDGADEQGLLRTCSDAFLARAVIVCEGATEIGLMRGLDLHWDQRGLMTMAAFGAALADGHGGSMVARACCFARLGYRTCLLRDADVPLAPPQQIALAQQGVTEFFWDPGLSTEQQLCQALPEEHVAKLVDIAIEEQGNHKVTADLRACDPQLTPLHFTSRVGLSQQEREHLGTAAKRGAWFKNITLGERVGREVLGPALGECTGTMPVTIRNLCAWVGA